MRKGFTLIELLIVIAIIGILAAALLVSLGGARRAGRDARRIGDLRQVQSALELYFNKCGHYPGDQTCGSSGDPASWADLDNILTGSGAGLGITDIPNDPTVGATYFYGVDTAGNRQRYVLGANLEADNRALQDDLDGDQFGVNCNDPTYCVGI